MAKIGAPGPWWCMPIFKQRNRENLQHVKKPQKMDEPDKGYEPETTSDDMSRADARLAAMAREKLGVQSRAARTPPTPQGAADGVGLAAAAAEKVPAATVVVVPPLPDAGRHVTLTREDVRVLGCDLDAGGRIFLVS